MGCFFTLLIVFFFLLPCCMACGILVPQPGMEPGPSELRVQSLTTGPPGNSLLIVYFFKKIYLCAYFLKKYLFIYLFWLRWVLAATCGKFIATCGLLSCRMRTPSGSMHSGSSSPTRGQTWAPCIGSTESYPLDHQGSID